MNKGDQVRNIWRGAMILTVAALFTKMLSAVYRIPFQNLAGDIGFYVYQQIYPFYGIAFILSTYGFPVVISKYLSEEKLEKKETAQVISLLFYTLLITSLTCTLLLFFLAPWLAYFMGDRNLTLPLQIIAFAFLAVPFLSTFRGYFQGHENMFPSAISQMFDQGVRVFFILLLAYLFVRSGYGPYGAGSGAALGSLFGACIGIGILAIFFKKEKIRLHFPQISRGNWRYIKQFLKDSLLFSLSALVLVFFQLVDSLTVLRFLQIGGMEEVLAMVLKGVYDRGQPLIQLGTVVTTSFALTIVPLIASVRAKGEETKAREYGELSLRLTCTVALCASIGLAIIIEPTNAMLFMNRDGSFILAIYALGILFSSFIMVTSAILLGYNQGGVVAKHIIGGIITKLLLNIVLVPIINVYGAACATVIGLAVIMILNTQFIYNNRLANSIPTRVLHKIGLVVAIMAVFTWLWKTFLEYFIFTGELHRLQEAVIALSSVLLALFIVSVTLLKLGIFSEREISVIPVLEKLYRQLNKK